MPNNSHPCHCACEISQSRTQVFICSIRVRVLGLGLVVWLGLIIPTCHANLVQQVIWQCDIFVMTPVLNRIATTVKTNINNNNNHCISAAGVHLRSI